MLHAARLLSFNGDDATTSALSKSLKKSQLVLVSHSRMKCLIEQVCATNEWYKVNDIQFSADNPIISISPQVYEPSVLNVPLPRSGF